MYLPAHFSRTDIDAIRSLIREAPLATLVTLSGAAIEADHVPLIAQERDGVLVLRGHVARANPLWHATDAGSEVLAIFHGPDAYVSPSLYATKAEHGKVVPTWNYAVAHLYGTLQVFDDPAWLHAFLPELTGTHEANRPKPWKVSDAPDDYIDRMVAAIVGIEIRVSRVIGKWKVSQNQPAANRRGVAAGLQGSDRRGAQAMARLVAGDDGADRESRAPAEDPPGGKG